VRSRCDDGRRTATLSFRRAPDARCRRGAREGVRHVRQGFLFRDDVVHHERLTEEVRRAYLAPHPTWSSRTGELVFPREIPDPASPSGPVAELLTQLEHGVEQHFRSKPARIMWPMRDPAFTSAVLEDWRKTLPDATVTPLDDASHYVQEDAYERIVPQLLSLVADTN
jgi:pimeloyl-ACP methyl ester carboxylesterase